MDTEARKALELARFKTIAGEVTKGGTVGVILVANGDALEAVRRYLLPLIQSPMRLYSQAGRRAEFANGSSVLFRVDETPEVVRGYRLDWVWLVSPKNEKHVTLWRASLRNVLALSRGKLYIGSEQEYEPSFEDPRAEVHRR